MTAESEYILSEIAKLNKKISDLESLMVRQGNFLNKIASEQEND